MDNHKRYTVRNREDFITARKVLGYTHTALAEACEVSRQYLYRVLNGEEIGLFRAEYISWKMTDKYKVSRKLFKRAYQSNRAGTGSAVPAYHFSSGAKR